ncbi:hypothetical protein N0V93_000516 [Gnomoniopsis smithogilvyi]|uniref:MICOS complex subunit MIC12 n=1 Tax=Gnomoniopsis smithogilvyi TaxID=1191159 RepID=A0A9W8Z456_9PEZI|nr:hypothetical protein N0V93_000516 [Gnomoniopsis smithogilvyi]
MGFTTGFTGGVTLVLGAAYLTLQSHQIIRQRQAETLRAQAYILNSLSYIPASAPPPKTIAEELALLEHQQELLAKAHRRRAERFVEASFIDRAKERWNAEIEAAVRWAANKDWIAAREDAEDTVSRLWARATGGELPSRTAERAGAALSEKAAQAATAARSAAEQTANRTKEAAQIKANEAKEAGTSIWERGFRKSKEVASQARAAVGLAEEKVQQKANGLVSVIETDAEKVIQKRFERKPEEVLKQSPEEVLEERYKSVV